MSDKKRSKDDDESGASQGSSSNHAEADDVAALKRSIGDRVVGFKVMNSRPAPPNPKREPDASEGDD